MNKVNFLLEIGTEEIPYSYLKPASEELAKKLEDLLKKFQFNYEQLTSNLFTPRRIAIHISNCDDMQNDYSEEIKGPPVKICIDDQGNFTPALQAFLNKNNLKNKQLEKRNFENKGEYFFGIRSVKGQSLKKILAENLPQIILQLSFPKSMVWDASMIKFARPIRWIVALLGQDVLKFKVGLLQSGAITQGHRVLGQEKIKLSQASLEEYKESLKKNSVFVDLAERQLVIENKIKEIEQKNNWVVDRSVLEEVTNLVEFPNACLAEFPDEFLILPREVIETSIQKHQRYFPISDQQGKIVQKFIVIFNHQDHVASAVRKGAEKIINARLADAKFFWFEDIKKYQEVISQNTRESILKQSLFQKDLGSYWDKTQRVKKILENLNYLINKEELVNAMQACDWMKFDLSSRMVYEFPNLQGTMGGYYLKQLGLNQTICQTVSEHYWPKFALDQIPQSRLGSFLALVDKMDTLAGCFLVGLIPTGSQDPYALRRQAIGALRIVWEKRINLSLSGLINEVFRSIHNDHPNKKNAENILYNFMLERLRNMFFAYDKDILDATINDLFLNKPLFEVMENIQKLQDLKKQWNDFSRLVALAQRPKNILKAAKVQAIVIEFHQDLLTAESEKELWKILGSHRDDLILNQVQDMTTVANRCLELFEQPMQRFFSEVMVMDKDERIKNNRLALLNEFNLIFDQFGDLSKIVL